MRGVAFRGARFDARTAAMLREVERITKRRVQVAQGSWSGALASAGTHAGPGAVDLRVQQLTQDQENELARAMRTVGFAYWTRPTVPGLWGRHGHGIAVGTKGLPDSAARQTVAFRNGFDGLAGEGGKRPDPQAWLGVKPTTWEAYLESKKPRRGRATITSPRGAWSRREPSLTARGARHRKVGESFSYAGVRTVDGDVWLRTLAGNWIRSSKTSRGA
jgi:hypothetical protein